VTWSPYWRLHGDGRLVAGRDRFMRLEAVQAGTYTATIDVTPRAALSQIWEQVRG
jgi:hypothetical protein